MRKALGYIERSVVVGGQLDGNVLQVGGAFRAQIHNDVEYGPTGASHELGLGGRGILKVHSPQGSPTLVEGDVGLRNDRLQFVIAEFVLAKGAREEAAVISAALDVDNERSL